MPPVPLEANLAKIIIVAHGVHTAWENGGLSLSVAYLHSTFLHYECCLGGIKPQAQIQFDFSKSCNLMPLQTSHTN